jgi:hypothetical protein
LSEQKQRPQLVGSFRGPYENSAARAVLDITNGAARCSTPEARRLFIGWSLDDFRSEFQTEPALITLVVTNTLARAARLGLLDGESFAGPSQPRNGRFA